MAVALRADASASGMRPSASSAAARFAKISGARGASFAASLSAFTAASRRPADSSTSARLDQASAEVGSSLSDARMRSAASGILPAWYSTTPE